MTFLFRLAPVLVLLAISIACLFPILALMTRFGWLDFQTTLPLLLGTTLTAVLVMALAGVTLILAIRAHKPAVKNRIALAILVLLIPLSVVVYFGLKVKQFPMIHNVSTSVAEPLVFEKIPLLRPPQANPLTPLSETIQLQKQFYPQLKSLYVKGSIKKVLNQAASTAEEMGWKLVSVDRDKGVIEATATTFWFGFTDDVAVRVQSSNQGVKVDLQSVSRIGKSDLGKNAARIQQFQSRLADAMGKSGD